MSENEKDKTEKEPKPKFVARTLNDIQRLKLKKLMDNPTKEIVIPTSNKKPNDTLLTATPSFVRNVMGSSAGAGSGEFHVYRHLRRKEFARQKQIQQKSKQEQLDDEFREKLEQNKLKADMKTAKKRAKRLKKKERAKKQKPNSNTTAENKNESTDDGSDGDSDKCAADKADTDDDKQEEIVN